MAGSAQDAVARVQSAVQAGQNVGQFFGLTDGPKSLAEQFLDALFRIRQARQLIPVEFNGRRLDNMAIISLVTEQNNEVGGIRYEIVFQQLRFKSQEFVDPADAFPNAAEGMEGSTEGQRDKGTQSGDEVDSSLLSDIFSLVGEGG